MCETVALDDWCPRCGQVTPQLAGLSVLGFPEQGCTICTRTVDHRWQDAGQLAIPDDPTGDPRGLATRSDARPASSSLPLGRHDGPEGMPPHHGE